MAVGIGAGCGGGAEEVWAGRAGAKVLSLEESITKGGSTLNLVERPRLSGPVRQPRRLIPHVK